ncbi:MAG: flagellar basal body-associated protein FliL [Kiritimatiellia bacterium]|jgi:flagellar basal body-associated protein FliL
MPEEDDDIPLAKPSMMPIIVAAVGALLVGAGAGFGASFLMMGDSTAEAAEDVDKPIELEDGTMLENPSAPHFHDLGRFTVNLRGGGGGRTLRMQVQLETQKRFQVDLEEASPRLRDVVITLTSDYTYGDVEGLDGKQRLKDDLLSAVTNIIDGEQVDHLYLTEFVVN